MQEQMGSDEIFNFTEHQKKLITYSEQLSLKPSTSILIIFGVWKEAIVPFIKHI